MRAYLPATNGVARGEQVFLEIEQVSHVVGQQAEAIDHKDPAAGFRLAQAVIDHQRHNFFSNPASGRAAAQEHHALIANARPRRVGRRHQRTGGDGCRALDIIIEAAQLVAVALQKSGGVFLRKVFKLQENVGPARLNRADKHIHKFSVLVVADARVTPAHVHRVVEVLLIIGADIQHNRQGGGRMDPSAGGIQRQLTNRYAHTADTLVAEA